MVYHPQEDLQIKKEKEMKTQKLIWFIVLPGTFSIPGKKKVRGVCPGLG